MVDSLDVFRLDVDSMNDSQKECVCCGSGNCYSQRKIVSNEQTMLTADVRCSIRCFKHCSQYVFCFELPEYCPVCKLNVLHTEMSIPPFITPSPFINDSWTKSRVFIRPAKGKCFLRDYKNGDDLHCGISDSQGTLYDFDELGVHIGPLWTNCIQITYNAGNVSSTQCLLKLAEQWKSMAKFHPLICNCFSFVLTALHSMEQYTEYDKVAFVEKCILPETKKAAEYISLYRNIVKNNGSLVKSI